MCTEICKAFSNKWKKVFTDINVIIPICITVILFVLLVSFKEKTDEKKTGDKND